MCSNLILCESDCSKNDNIKTAILTKLKLSCNPFLIDIIKELKHNGQSLSVSLSLTLHSEHDFFSPLSA